jgi:prepilin-type N-terminal cleavage/methylation domain-containing protein
MKQSNGFTIIEVIIVLGVSTILMLGLFTLFDWHQKVYVQEEATVRTVGDARSTLNSMGRYIAQGSSILVSHDFNGTVYTTGGNVLVLEVPSVNSSDEIIPATYDYVAYYLDSGNIHQVIDAGSGSTRLSGTKKLASNVLSFSLTYNNGTPSQASNVTIDLQTQITTRNGNVTTHVTDTIFLRNK